MSSWLSWLFALRIKELVSRTGCCRSRNTALFLWSIWPLFKFSALNGQSMIHSDNGILFSAKKRNYQAMRRHRGKLNTYCWVKKNGCGKAHTLSFQLCNILQWSKLWRQQRSLVARGWEAGQAEHRGFSGQGNSMMFVVMGTVTEYSYRKYTTTSKP